MIRTCWSLNGRVKEETDEAAGSVGEEGFVPDAGRTMDASRTRKLMLWCDGHSLGPPAEQLHVGRAF